MKLPVDTHHPTEEEAIKLRKFVRDLAEQGLRFDLTPTHDQSNRETCEAFWHRYFSQADQSVRERAKLALGY